MNCDFFENTISAIIIIIIISEIHSFQTERVAVKNAKEKS